MSGPRRSAPSGRIQGAANREATKKYFQETARTYHHYRHEFWSRDVRGLPFSVSRLGFGTYRCRAGNRNHFDALREALLTGTNVIDTAASYGEGEAEILVGGVIKELIKARRLEREQVAVIGKAGFFTAPDSEQKKKFQARYGGSEGNESICHSLHPDFLSDRLENSLRDLGLSTLDVYLLENPEYYLKQATRRGVPLAEAREKFEVQLRQAFVRLEELVGLGKISSFGISSNTFCTAPEDPHHLALDRILEIAPSHFRVLQFPANMIEVDFKFQRISAGRTLGDLSDERGLWTLGNRPFNAAVTGVGRFRLAGIPEPPPDEGAATVAELHRLTDLLVSTEQKIVAALKHKHFRFSSRFPAFSDIISINLNRVCGVEHLRQKAPLLMARMQKTINHLFFLGEEAHHRYMLENYIKLSNSLLSLWEGYTVIRHQNRLQKLTRALSRISPALRDRGMADQALLFLLAAGVPQTVLVGMRHIDYVRQLKDIYSSQPPPESDQLPLSSEAARQMEKLGSAILKELQSAPAGGESESDFFLRK